MTDNLLQSGFNIFIENLDYFVTDRRLRKEFMRFGTIKSTKVMRERGVSKGFGFVCFTTFAAAMKAITEMHGQILGTKPMGVFLVKHSQYILAKYMEEYEFPVLELPVLELPVLELPVLELTSDDFIQDSEERSDVQMPFSQQLYVQQDQEPLTAPILAPASPQERWQKPDVDLFPQVFDMSLGLSDGITSTVLDTHKRRLLQLCDNYNSLNAKFAKDIQDREQMPDVRSFPHVNYEDHNLVNVITNMIMETHKHELCNISKFTKVITHPEEREQQMLHVKNENVDLAKFAEWTTLLEAQQTEQD